MEKIDARTLKDDALHEHRRHVIRQHKRGNRPAQIARISELSDPAVRKIIRLYEAGRFGRTQAGVARSSRRWAAPFDGRTRAVSTATHLREAARATENGVCVMDACRGQPVHRARVCGVPAGPYRWALSETLGPYPAKADQESLRTAPRSSQAVA